MASVEQQEIEHAHFIANEMNFAFDRAEEWDEEDNREDMMELANILAGVALLAGEEAPSESETLKYSLIKAVDNYHKRDNSEVNFEIIENAIDKSLADGQRHYTRFDADFEDEMAGEYRGKILSKAYWHVKFHQEVEKAKYQGSDLSLVFIDFNFVKKVNDLYGHPEGDKLLRDMKTLFAMVAEEFRLASRDGHQERPTDLLSYGKTFDGSMPEEEREGLMETGRLGGDEFAAICYTDNVGATVISDRVREMVEEYVNSEGNEHLKELGLNAAIGLASLQGDMTASELLALADGRMYEDKEEQKEARKPLLDEEQERAVTDAEEILQLAGLTLETVQDYRRRN